MAWSVGVDVGGTFTDFCASNEQDGRIVVHKTLSTPDNPALAIADGLQALCERAGIDPAEISRFSHGTTVGTNTLIERKGGKVAVITTNGFRDLMEIGRQTRPKIYSIQEDYPPPLAPRKRCFEVVERVGANGEIIEALAEESILDAVRSVRECGAEACAICLLFSFRFDAHERAIAARLRSALPEVHQSLSSDIYPEIREYERFSTTVLNAYLQPVFDSYLTVLERTLGEYVPNAVVGINQSNGGLTSVERARRYPVRTVLSGPAAGVMGAVHGAACTSFRDVITLDMGGTSADVGLIRQREADVGTSRDVAGVPVRLPMLDIHTVGAGGGSIAWFDRDGLLKVGPLSAGADPGPACYGTGGKDPTVSDANVVLGRLDPAGLLDGAMSLDVDAARRAIFPVARRIGFAVEAAALGIIEIVVSNMVRAVRKISVERGYDPREFALMPYGGAGGLHAVDVARALSMRTVIVPRAPGILCAHGLVVADHKEDRVRSTRVRICEHYRERVHPILATLDDELTAWFESERVDETARHRLITLDMRYVGQNYELRVPLPGATITSLPESDEIVEMFFREHERSYGYHSAGDNVEIINVRLTGLGRRSPHRSDAPLPVGVRAAPEPASVRPVYFRAETPHATPIYRRSDLVPGHGLDGPAIVSQMDATTVIAPNDRLSVDAQSNLIVEVAA